MRKQWMAGTQQNTFLNSMYRGSCFRAIEVTKTVHSLWIVRQIEFYNKLNLGKDFVPSIC
ncbi:hypothetical protein B1J94_14800 [Leptospira kirschneri serovar Grippotyphosa]|nr:hypothetical protein B1J94_14800 [Leptospira kirschneri serovar Grippotyphosa]